jgi:hypothetical protein
VFDAVAAAARNRVTLEGGFLTIDLREPRPELATSLRSGGRACPCCQRRLNIPQKWRLEIPHFVRWVFAPELARERTHSAIAEAAPLLGGSESVVRLGEFMMILDLHRQGLSPTAIAFRCQPQGSC